MSSESPPAPTAELKRAYMRGRTFAIVAFLAAVGVLACILSFVSWISGDPKLARRLEKEGARTAGTVDKISVVFKTNNVPTACLIHYSYFADGRRLTASAVVPVDGTRPESGERIGVLYDPADPPRSVPAIFEPPVGELSSGKDDHTVLTAPPARVRALTWRPPAVMIFALYVAMLLLLILAGAAVWRRAKAARVINNPVAVPGVVIQDTDSTRTFPPGAPLKIAFLTDSGRAIVRNLPRARRKLEAGQTVTVFYEPLRPKNFVVAELYCRPAATDWGEAEKRLRERFDAPPPAPPPPEAPRGRYSPGK